MSDTESEEEVRSQVLAMYARDLEVVIEKAYYAASWEASLAYLKPYVEEDDE